MLSETEKKILVTAPRVSLDAGLLQLVLNMLQRDADAGMASRKEVLELIKLDVKQIEA